MAGVRGAELASLWGSLAVLLVLALALGRGARRLGLPPVVGALTAGLLANPSALGAVWPGAYHWLFPGTPAATHLLGGVTSFGLLVLAFVLGTETDVELLTRNRTSIAAVSVSSFLLPLAAGAAVGLALPRSYLGSAASSPALALLVGLALAVSSLPIVAWTLRELGLLDTLSGRVAIGVSTVQDAAGFLLLALAVGLASGSNHRLEVAAGGLVAAALFAVTVGPRLVDRLLHGTHVDDHAEVGLPTALLLALMLVAAAALQAAHLDGAFGAFLAGMLVARSPYRPRAAVATLDNITSYTFAPLYFAAAGVSVDLGQLSSWRFCVLLLAVAAVAAVTKFLGVYAGAVALRLPRRQTRFLGVALNGRGAMQLIIAGVGLRHGVLSDDAYTLIVLVSLVVNLVIPTLLAPLADDPEPAPATAPPQVSHAS